MSSVILENQKNSPQMRLSPLEVEKTKKMLQKDVMQYNNDIQLLSLLIGRPLNAQDLEKLAKTNLGKASTRIPTPTTSQTTTTTSRVTPQPTTRQSTASSSIIPAFKALSSDEKKFLEALQQIQTTRAASTTTTTQSTVPTRSRSQEAIIAALLRQQGIGPSINGNNQVQLDVILISHKKIHSINKICYRKYWSNCQLTARIEALLSLRRQFDHSHPCHRWEGNRDP